MVARGFAIFLLLGLPSIGLAVDFNLQDINGVQQRLADYRGKWVVVNFWASWCRTCIEELAELDFFNNQNSKEAVVLGLNIENDKSSEELRQFTELYAVDYPILRSPWSLPGYGEITLIPTTLIISPVGEVMGRKLGRVSGAYLEDLIVKGQAPKNADAMLISEIGP